MVKRFGFALLLVLAVVMACLPSMAIASDPFNRYYSAGSYDGYTWCAITDETASDDIEYNEYYGEFSISNNSAWSAQTFTPRVDLMLTYASVYGYGSTANTDNSLVIAIQGTTSGDPDNVDLATSDVLLVDTPLGEDNATWMQITFDDQIQLIAGTMYALVVRYDNAGQEFSWGYITTGSYPRGTRVRTVNSGVAWTQSAGDMAFRIYGSTTTYSEVHEATTGSVATSRMEGEIGQATDNTLGAYSISRAGLFFNTSDIAITDNIQSAVLQVWVSVDMSTTDFELVLVDGSGLTGPMAATDYYELLSQTDNCGSVWTSDLVSGGYTSISLNSDNGLALISKDGYTRIGLRSSNDIDWIAPTGNEYISIFMGEADHPPILTITYKTGALGIPDEMTISNVSVYAGYQEAGDELYVWYNTLRYEETPPVTPEKYFTVELVDDNGTTQASVSVMEWGYSPLSIYLSAAQVTTSGIAWNDNFSLVLGGTTLYSAPTGYSDFTYFMESGDWVGVTNPHLDSWVRGCTEWLEAKNGEAPGTYSTTNINGGWCVDPLAKAQSLFFSGIQYIDIVRPNLFIVSSDGRQSAYNPTSTYADDLYDDTWGTYWTGAFGNLAGGWGMTGQWVIGILIGVLIICIGAFIRSKTNEPNLPIVVMGILAVVAIFIGSFPMNVVMVGTAVVLYLLLHNLFLSRT